MQLDNWSAPKERKYIMCDEDDHVLEEIFDMEAVNLDGVTFDEWMQEVDEHITAICGLTSGDLADQCYWDAWNDGVKPSEQAMSTLRDEGFPIDELMGANYSSY